jgi:hypothetical protein
VNPITSFSKKGSRNDRKEKKTQNVQKTFLSKKGNQEYFE